MVPVAIVIYSTTDVILGLSGLIIVGQIVGLVGGAIAMLPFVNELQREVDHYKQQLSQKATKKEIK